jgi:hypothetical protein
VRPSQGGNATGPVNKKPKAGVHRSLKMELGRPKSNAVK